jgi:hypothetical protein
MSGLRSEILVVLLMAACGARSRGDCTDTATCADAGGAKGEEDCANGNDDDGDGLVDCADPDCAARGFACWPAPPAGWSGPVALAARPEASPLPDCAAPFGEAVLDGGEGFEAPGATCTCLCSKPTGVTCTGGSVRVHSDLTCSSPCGAERSFAVGDCLSTGCTASALAISWTTSGGRCEPRALPAPSRWRERARACAVSGSRGGCGEAVCAPAAPAGFAAKLCVVRAGEHACPGAPYTDRALYDAGTKDDRTCDCACGAPVGTACSAQVAGYTDASCTQATGVPAPVSGACGAYFASSESVALRIAEASPSIVSPGTCAPSGGSVTAGSVQPDRRTTVCCAR